MGLAAVHKVCKDIAGFLSASLSSSPVFADRLIERGPSWRLESVPTARKVRLPYYVPSQIPRVSRRESCQDIRQFASFQFKVQAEALKGCRENILL